MKKEYLVLASVTLIVIVSLSFAFFKVGGPNEARDRKFDNERTSNIYNLKYAIENYYSANSELPKTLQEATDAYGSYSQDRLDPQTKKEYTYKAGTGSKYSLCATFLTESSEKDSEYMAYGTEFAHPKGYHCFNLDAQSEYSYAATPTRIPFPSISPIHSTSTFMDTNIEKVTLLLPDKSQLNNASHFPYGFFSSNTSEWGLITEETSATVEVEFKKPVRLSEVRIDVDNCETINCYVWSANAITTDGSSISIAQNLPAGSLETGFVNPDLNSQVTMVTLTVGRGIIDPSYIFWKKIQFTYK